MEEKCRYEMKGETMVIDLPQELDHDCAGMIRRETDKFFVENRVRNVIFNYRNTSFMDSSGIGLVMGRYRQVRYLRGNIYIVGVGKAIERIMEISGLYRVAKVRETVEQAIREIEA